MKIENLEDLYELSPLQQGILFHSLYAPSSGVYFEQFICTFTGPLDVKHFRQAWQHVANRHPILRTSFHWEDLDKPLQAVHRELKLPLTELDWTHLSVDEQQAELGTFLQSDRSDGFEPSKAPLLRLALIRLEEDKFEFIWSRHHLILDRWSRLLILKEVFATYDALGEGKSIELSPAPSFAEYIGWLQKQNLSAAESFWRQNLKGFTTPTRLGVDKGHFSGKATDYDQYEEVQLKLPSSITEEFQSFCRKNQLTLNTLVQGAWAILLSRYSGDQDILFGFTLTSRPPRLPGVERIVGPCINTLPIRCQISTDERLIDFLANLQKEQVEIRQYEYSSLVEIQGWSEVQRGEPLFDTLLVFENIPGGVISQSVKGSEISNIRSSGGRTNYPLTILVGPDRELLLRVIYDGKRFDSDTIQRLLGHLRTLLEGILTNPDQAVSKLPILTAAETQQLIVDWNNTTSGEHSDECIHRLFERQVKRSPERPAVRFQEEKLSYDQLNCSANQLARYLRSNGIGPEKLVGIFLDRSLCMIQCLLAVMKAGAAYVPLDPTYPKDRLAFMLQDSKVSALLTQEDLLERLPSSEAKILRVDADRQKILRQETTNLNEEFTSNSLAYVIYTSGSTGKPKAVEIEHRNVVNCLEAMKDHLDLNKEDVLLAVTTLSFDISVLELFLPLVVGAQMIVASHQERSETDRLMQKLSAHRPTVIQATPATWVLLLQAGWHPDGGMKMLCGGETLNPTLASSLLAGSSPLWNLYGPTETTIWSLIRRVEAGDDPVPIGKPIRNTQVYLLDTHMNPVPVGVVGQLYIGGAGVARGYRNQPALTAEKFVRNPFSADPESRMYKTGDLARYMLDGNIEFIGRSDHQVKIRGYRIELGEIEAALKEFPGVEDSVVITREDIPGEKLIMAYYVAKQTPPSVNQLRAFLKEKLPEFMIPTVFVHLDSFPVLPNGKLDRSALPASEGARPNIGSTFVAPRNVVEEILGKIWSEVLSVNQIGIQDNFFDLGGHSLFIMRIISQIRDRFQVELPLRTIFETPTISELALTIAQRKTAETDPHKIGRMLQELEGLSDEETQLLLQAKQQQDDAS